MIRKKISVNKAWSCVTPEKETVDVYQSQKSNDGLIKNMKKSIQKEQIAFRRKQEKLYEEFKVTETKRCEMLKNYSGDFIAAFDNNTDDYKELLDNYKPAKDLERWEKEIFLHNIDKLETCQAVENEDY